MEIYRTQRQSPGILLFIGGSLIFGSVGTLFLIQSVLRDGNPLGWGLVFVFFWGLYSLASMFYMYWSVAVKIELTEDSIIATKLLGRVTKIGYEEIRVIQRRKLFSNDVGVYSKGGASAIFLHPLTVDFGELIEELSYKSSNLTFFYLGELPEKTEYWQKEPSWNTINTVKRRVKENRS